VAHVTAVHCHRFLRSGRNHPALFGCIDADGNSAGDYVVKLRGAMDTKLRGPASELIASLLAGHFGVLRPKPAAVRVHPDLTTWLAAHYPEHAAAIRDSTGLNFGTELLTDVATWPRGRTVPEAMHVAATHIFAFDALIANDDRRYNNPNVLVRGDEIFVIDHEAAFAFLYLVSLGEAPWELRRRNSLREHVFYHPLRKQEALAPDVSSFIARLAQLGHAELEASSAKSGRMELW